MPMPHLSREASALSDYRSTMCEICNPIVQENAAHVTVLCRRDSSSSARTRAHREGGSATHLSLRGQGPNQRGGRLLPPRAIESSRADIYFGASLAADSECVDHVND